MRMTSGFASKIVRAAERDFLAAESSGSQRRCESLAPGRPVGFLARHHHEASGADRCLVLDDRRRFAQRGHPNRKDELARRQACLVAHARRSDERHAELLRQVHDRRQGRRADGAEQRKHVVFLDQRPRLAARTRRVIAVVPVSQDDASATDSSLRVDAGDADLRTAGMLPGHRAEGRRARGHDTADGQRRRRDARIARQCL